MTFPLQPKYDIAISNARRNSSICDEYQTNLAFIRFWGFVPTFNLWTSLTLRIYNKNQEKALARLQKWSKNGRSARTLSPNCKLLTWRHTNNCRWRIACNLLVELSDPKPPESRWESCGQSSISRMSQVCLLSKQNWSSKRFYWENRPSKESALL